jgi:ABC-type glucose/galactose transport system permease subunit
MVRIVGIVGVVDSVFEEPTNLTIGRYVGFTEQVFSPGRRDGAAKNFTRRLPALPRLPVEYSISCVHLRAQSPVP